MLLNLIIVLTVHVFYMYLMQVYISNNNTYTRVSPQHLTYYSDPAHNNDIHHIYIFVIFVFGSRIQEFQNRR